LQCVATCCSVLQRVAVCVVLQCVAVCCSVLQWFAYMLTVLRVAYILSAHTQHHCNNTATTLQQHCNTTATLLTRQVSKVSLKYSGFGDFFSCMVLLQKIPDKKGLFNGRLLLRLGSFEWHIHTYTYRVIRVQISHGIYIYMHLSFA